MFSNLNINAVAEAVRDAFTRFEGGLDLETPDWDVKPGRAFDSLNYEISIAGGYQDIRGYERFDGRPKPSDASFTIVDITITGALAVGNTATGATTGATGKIIALDTYPDTPAQHYMVLTKVTGTWNNAAENITVAAVVQANTDAAGYANSAPTALLKARYKNLAADIYRADIAVVPGEGNVWGGFSLGDNKYAIRNAVGGATAVLFKAGVAGWAAVPLGFNLPFTSGGVYEIVEGNVITGATSAATATVTRVQVTSGDWAAGTAVGYLTFTTKTGNFQAENLNVGANLNVATIAGNATAQTLLPSGRLDYDISNFADPQGNQRVYCADRVNTGYEFDGTVFAFIHTGMTDDTPDHVIEHKRQLFFSFDGSVQHSAPGEPFAWSVILGAAELATKQDVTGFETQPGAEGNGALLIACRQQHFILYGNDVVDWNLVAYREKVGAYEWTIQSIAQTLFLDDRGITDLQTSQRFGNFEHSALSDRIRTLVASKKPLAVASCVVRDKNQYRLFFSDKTAIYVTMAGTKLMGMMPVTLPNVVTTIWSEETSTGTEEVFFGSDDGFVYQAERGTSFDGANIFAYIRTHFDNLKAIEWMKEFFAPVTIEAKGTGYAEFSLAYQLDYGRAEVAQPIDQAATIPAAQSSSWDVGLVWDTGLVWDNVSIVPSVGLDLRGEGRNISWIVTKDSDEFEPLLLSGIHFHFSNHYRVTG